MSFTPYKAKNIIIFGAGHGIGLSLVKSLIPSAENIYATYRKSENAQELLSIKSENLNCIKLDPLDGNQLDELRNKIERVDFIINSIGFLHTDLIKPEKSINAINVENQIEYFKVNSIITPLIAKYFTPLIRKSSKELECCFCTISAKIGSISDNELGGWYGYRASKAALNMYLKTLDREYKRNKINCTVRIIHPGTTITELSKPYTSNTKYKLHTTDETAKNILDVINSTSNKEHLFYSWDGSKIDY